MISNFLSIITILMIVTSLAYLSQKKTLAYEAINLNNDGRKHIDVYLFTLIVFLILFAGLRTNYNDTATYISGFHASENIFDFIKNPENLELISNPIFYGLQALFRTYTDNANVFFLFLAIFIQTRLVIFIKQSVEIENFAMTMFLYCCIGTLTLSISAQKQIFAMAVLTFAIEYLIKSKFIRFYIVVFIAGLIHTYAWLFIVLPFVNTKLWSWNIYVLLFITIVVMYTFQNSISSFLEVADMIGKNIPVEEVLASSSMNIFRVLVYGIVPIFSFCFKRELKISLDKKNILFIHMSIINLLFMIMGMMNGANMFGRAGRYFEIGYICSLPIIIKKLFNESSTRMILFVAVILFVAFFLYDNQYFFYEYQFKSLIQFLGEIL